VFLTDWLRGLLTSRAMGQSELLRLYISSPFSGVAIPEAVSARRRLGNATRNPSLAQKHVFARGRGVTAE